MLDLSRIDEGSLHYTFNEINIKDLVRDIVDSAKKDIYLRENVSIEFTSSVPADLHMRGDAARLEQALINIINNAIKFTMKGSIRITLLRGPHTIRIIISDTGFGIPKEILPQLFDKFVTSENNEISNQRGTGLGLYISKAIVVAHGGRIYALNNDKHGATFVIELPIMNDSTLLQASKEKHEHNSKRFF